MLFSSTRSLIRHYKKHRIYATEINYYRNDEPTDLILYLIEYNREIRMDISSILKKKRLRSRNETMFHLKNSRDQTMLLFLDHRRGNHYIYCNEKTYKHLLEQSQSNTRESSNHEISYSEVATAIMAPLQPNEISNKIIILDSYVICQNPELLNKLIEKNEIIISPYYLSEIETYVSNMTQRNKILAMIDTLYLSYMEKLHINQYAEPDQNRGLDLSNEYDYVMALANQQNVTSSQLIIMTEDDDLSMKATLQGFTVYHPLEKKPSESIRPALTTTSQMKPTVVTDNSNNPQEKGLPPRSQRHRRQNLHTFNNIANNLRSFFYSIII